MEKLFKNITFIVFAFLIISGLIILYSAPQEKPTDISLSELVDQINQGQVKTIDISENVLSIELLDGRKERTNKESESSLTESLANYDVNKDRLKELKIEVKNPSSGAFWMGAILPFLIPFILIGFFIWFMMRQAQRGNAQALSFGLSKARMLDPKNKKKRIMFADVAGSKEAKEELQEVVEFLKHPKKFLDLGAKIPKGVILLGPPGTGKTLLAKAVAGEAGVPFFNISGSEFVEMFVGVGASRVRDLFKNAKRSAPAIVFIDEIDAVGRHRGAGLGGGHDEREQTLNQILVEMDGFETTTNVIVIAATNRPDVLDPALLRPGRFDRRVTIDLPDINEREEILKIHAKNKTMTEGIKLRVLAERTPGFSGADLANLLNEAAILTARRSKKQTTMDELKEAVEKVMLGPERRSRVINEKEKKIIAYHEAGHALIANTLPNADPVQKISIISRGHAGGYTMTVPTEDKHLHSRSYFVDELATLLGGYVTEAIKFQEVTTGASNDLERATQIARNMVTRYGMSDMGARTFGKKEELIFLGREVSEEKNYSELTAQEIDKEVSKFIAQARTTAERIIKEKDVELEKITNTLIEKETIEKDEFDALVGNPAPIQEETKDETIAS